MNPFRGLEFFDSEHAPLFFGRAKVIENVLEVLRQQAAEKRPFVLVLGPGASGKTSLVRAGILPALTQTGTFEPDRRWRVVFARPSGGRTGDPVDALATSLLQGLTLPEFPHAANGNGWRELAAELRETPEDAALRLRETLQFLSAQAPNGKPGGQSRKHHLPVQGKVSILWANPSRPHRRCGSHWSWTSWKSCSKPHQSCSENISLQWAL